jgi:hypothetical protein
MAAQSGVGKDGLPAQIWIASANPADSLMRRVSDSSEAIRNDPEPVVFADSAFIYYTHVILNQKSSSIQYSVRKCDTGLANIYSSKKSNIPSVPNFSIYPNPGDGKFRYSASSVFRTGSKIIVYDSSGRSVFSKVIECDTSELNLSNLPSGSYTVKINTLNAEASTHLYIVK